MDQSIQKIFYFILKTETLAAMHRYQIVMLFQPMYRLGRPRNHSFLLQKQNNMYGIEVSEKKRKK